MHLGQTIDKTNSNSYVLLSMITDQDPLVRSDGYEKIIFARNEVTTCIRQMFGPEVDNFINFESDSYVDMINWNKFHLTEPPCLQFYTQDQLEDLQSSYEIIELPAETANQPGKTATIEMYAPSSFNDTVTGETLSSVSEKSESYSNDGSQDYLDEARKKAASTYLVDNTDLPPPRYQQDGTMPSLYPNNMVNARTLPHPRHNNMASVMDHRARDDQMLINKTVFIPSPSPALPPDGSYYNMNSDRYLSYPPMDYPHQIDFTQPLSIGHIQPVSQASMISGTLLSATPAIGNGGSGTLRRGILKGVSHVPQPDVTHHTTSSMGGMQLLHDLHPLNISSTSSTLTTTSSVGNGSLMSVPNSIQRQPQSILKDPNRLKTQQPSTLMNASIVTLPGTPGALQVLNIPTSAGISNNLLMTASAAYDPTNPHSLTTFNAAGATVTFTDADGHLV